MEKDIFINDLSKVIVHSNILFANDVKIYKVIKHLKDSEYLQINLNNIHYWCIKNNLSLNINVLILFFH